MGLPAVPQRGSLFFCSATLELRGVLRRQSYDRLLIEQPTNGQKVACFAKTNSPIMIGVFVLLFLLAAACCHAFNLPMNQRLLPRHVNTRMLLDPHSVQHIIHEIPTWAQFAAQGMADGAVVAVPDVAQDAATGAGAAEEGFSAMSILSRLNPFAAFDSFQQTIQESIQGLDRTLKGFGLKEAYGPSIILFTCLVRLCVLPLNFRQIKSSSSTAALQPKLKEIKEKFPDNKELQNQLSAMVFQEAKVNPLAGCFPAIVQIPVFLSLYRSFLSLASEGQMDEPFLWVPNLVGPTFGTRSIDWLTKGWVDNIPPLGWHDTIAYLTLPVMLVIAQSISLKVLTPPSEDPAVQRTNAILKYLPLLLGYFALSVPAGLGVYWVTNNLLSTLTTVSIKQYFKANPLPLEKINIDELANSQNSAYYNPAWGYSSKEQMYEEAKLHYRPPRVPRVPADFV